MSDKNSAEYQFLRARTHAEIERSHKMIQFLINRHVGVLNTLLNVYNLPDDAVNVIIEVLSSAKEMKHDEQYAQQLFFRY
jgi:hypothetical protein